MKTIADLPMLRLAVPPSLKMKGAWVDNGPLSNFSEGQAVIRFRSVATRRVEPAYVAAKNPDALVPSTAAPELLIPFHERVAAHPPARVKALGKPRSKGGLIDTTADFEETCVGAMASFGAQKFAHGTAEAAWLAAADPRTLVEWTNWGDRRWGVAFRNGDAYADGRNALGLILALGQDRLRTGRPLATADEADWKALQLALLPLMAAKSKALFGAA